MENCSGRALSLRFIVIVDESKLCDGREPSAAVSSSRASARHLNVHKVPGNLDLYYSLLVDLWQQCWRQPPKRDIFKPLSGKRLFLPQISQVFGDIFACFRNITMYHYHSLSGAPREVATWRCRVTTGGLTLRGSCCTAPVFGSGSPRQEPQLRISTGEFSGLTHALSYPLWCDNEYILHILHKHLLFIYLSVIMQTLQFCWIIDT